jgi:hypothetical protein
MNIWADKIAIGLGVMEFYQPWLAISLPFLLALALLLVLWFSYQRLGQSHKGRLALVWLLNVWAFIAVSGLIYDVQIARQGVNSVVLLTSGAAIESPKNVDDGQQVFVMADWAMQNPKHPLLARANIIDDAAQLASLRPELEHLHILGDGLSPSQWQTYLAINSSAKRQKLAISFSPSAPSLGPIDMSWQKQLAPGEFQEISGILQVAKDDGGKDYQLALIDPRQQVLEQLGLKAGETFKFKFASPQLGQWIYRLQVSESSNGPILADEPIAFEVSQQHAPALLIKQSAPSFETRQLKNWASRFGSRLTIVSQISQNNSIVQQLNLSDEPGQQQLADPFLNATLDDYDLLIIDERALSTLPQEQLSLLYSAIYRGLGLLLIADGTSLTERHPLPWLNEFVIKPRENKYQSVPRWPNSELRQTINIPALELITPQVEVLVNDNEGQPLVAAASIGLGKVAISLINNTYQWQTAGQSSEYSHYWQSLLKQLTRGTRASAWIRQNGTEIYYSHQAIELCALSNNDSVYLQMDAQISLTAVTFQADKRCVSHWSQRSGWLEFDLATGSIGPIEGGENSYEVADRQMNYLYHNTDWQTWQQANKHRVTTKMASLSPAAKPTNHFAAVNKHIFWWLLLISSTLLWLERKFYHHL